MALTAVRHPATLSDERHSSEDPETSENARPSACSVASQSLSSSHPVSCGTAFGDDGQGRVKPAGSTRLEPKCAAARTTLSAVAATIARSGATPNDPHPPSSLALDMRRSTFGYLCARKGSDMRRRYGLHERGHERTRAEVSRLHSMTPRRGDYRGSMRALKIAQ